MDRDNVTPEVDSFPGENAEEWVDYHQEHSAPSTYVYDFVWNSIDEAIGPFCKDVDGNVLMDMTAHVGANTLGYNNPKILDQLEEMFDGLPFDPTKIAGQDFYIASGKTPETSEFPNPSVLMDRLTDISSHYDMDTVFLSNSGAEAVENAIKIAYHDTEGKYGITFEGAFHGRTLGTLSLNRSKGIYREEFPEISSIETVPFCRDSGCSSETCSCGFFTRGDESMLEKYIGSKSGHMNPDEIAYIILEPIQGEGGYYVPSQQFMKEVARIAEKHDIYIISDEVQAGFGRSGEWWGADNYAIEPDIIAAAKPARVGVTLANSDVFPDKKSRLSSTWGAGDIVATAQGVATINAIEEHNLMENAIEKGDKLSDQIRGIDTDLISQVRDEALMIGVEFADQSSQEQVVDTALEHGLMLLSCGQKTIRVLPPLDVTNRECDLFIDIFNSVLEEVEA